MVPERGSTLLSARIERWARTRPNDLAFLFLADGENESDRLTFSELDNRARRLSGRIRRAGLTGQPVLLPAQSGLEFILALCGCIYAGAIAVPCPFQIRNRAQERIQSIARDAGIVAVIGGTEVITEDLIRLFPSVLSISIGNLEAEEAVLVACDPQRPVLLQYTSGSTSAPKGVVISHRNLLTNIAMFSEALGVHRGTRMLTWLPLFHDMGLIGNVLAALQCGVPCVVMPPLSFLQKPRRWLEAISRHAITLSMAPNFAYEICVRRLGSRSLEGLDLRSWEVAVCGAEPVRCSTMQRFAKAFAPAGFRETALCPCYGLAEATVFVSGGPVGQGIKIIPDRARVLNDQVPPTLVSCGRSPLTATIRIVDPDTCEPVPDGSEGEIWVSGDHVAKRYWNNPPATIATFSATLSNCATVFLRTGDLGLIWQNELYVTGRRKSLIIYRGLNLHPEDVETTIADCHSGFGTIGAAFSVDIKEEEQVVVTYEVLKTPFKDDDAQAMIEEALKAVGLRHGVRLFDLVLMRPGTLPRTTSGKAQRNYCRTLYLSGELARMAYDCCHPSLGRYQSAVVPN